MKLPVFIKRETAVALLFLAPSLAGFALFYAIPFIMGLGYSFLDSPVDGIFVGLDNYKSLFASSSFRKAAANTALFTLFSVPLMLGLSITIALLLNQSIYLRKWLRTAYILPLVVPVASVVFIWQALFDWNGVLNAGLHSWGMNRIDWMKMDGAIGVVTLVYIWKNIGYNVILFLAGIQSIPESYYELANLEGAGSFRKFRSITLVYLIPTMFFVILMSIINSFKVFRETYLIAGDYPHDSIYMLQHYMNNMFLSLDLQKLTSAASVMVGGIMIIVLGLFMLERRFRNYME